MSEPSALSLASPETRRLGPFDEEIKKTSIHLARRSAFVSVHPRKTSLLITIKARSPSKARASSRPSRSPAEIDPELLGWAKAAYDLSL